MLTRTQFLIMLLLSIAGTAFAWYLQSFVNWIGTLEWFKQIQLYEFLCACVFVIGILFAFWVNEAVNKIVKTRDEIKLFEDEHKERVAEKVYRSKLRNQKVGVE